MTAKSDVVFATGNLWVTPTVFIHYGDLWAADDPVVKANPHLFTSDGSQFIHATARHPSGEPTAAAAAEADFSPVDQPYPQDKDPRPGKDFNPVDQPYPQDKDPKPRRSPVDQPYPQDKPADDEDEDGKPVEQATRAPGEKRATRRGR